MMDESKWQVSSVSGGQGKRRGLARGSRRKAQCKYSEQPHRGVAAVVNERCEGQLEKNDDL